MEEGAVVAVRPGALAKAANIRAAREPPRSVREYVRAAVRQERVIFGLAEDFFLESLEGTSSSMLTGVNLSSAAQAVQLDSGYYEPIEGRGAGFSSHTGGRRLRWSLDNHLGDWLRFPRPRELGCAPSFGSRNSRNLSCYPTLLCCPRSPFVLSQPATLLLTVAKISKR